MNVKSIIAGLFLFAGLVTAGTAPAAEPSSRLVEITKDAIKPGGWLTRERHRQVWDELATLPAEARQAYEMEMTVVQALFSLQAEDIKRLRDARRDGKVPDRTDLAIAYVEMGERLKGTDWHGAFVNANRQGSQFYDHARSGKLFSDLNVPPQEQDLFLQSIAEKFLGTERRALLLAGPNWPIQPRVTSYPHVHVSLASPLLLETLYRPGETSQDDSRVMFVGPVGEVDMYMVQSLPNQSMDWSYLREGGVGIRSGVKTTLLEYFIAMMSKMSGIQDTQADLAMWKDHVSVVLNWRAQESKTPFMAAHGIFATEHERVIIVMTGSDLSRDDALRRLDDFTDKLEILPKSTP